MAEEKVTTALAVVEKKAPPLPEKVADLTENQKGWLQLAHRKAYTQYELQLGELEIQKLLNGIDTTTPLIDIQDALAKAKTLAAEKKEVRLFFTKVIDEKLITMLMAYEKRNEELIKQTQAVELDVRTTENENNKKKEAKEKEEKLYKAHIQNEYSRVFTEWKITLTKRVNFYYTQALKEKKRNAKELKIYKEEIWTEIANIEPGKPVKYDRQYVTVDEAKAIVASIEKPDYAGALKEVQDSIEGVFAMYSEDMKNAEAAALAATKRVEEASSKATAAVAQASSINTLQASADTVTIGNSGGAKITVKETWEIEEENTTEWATAVMTNFIGNIGKCTEKLLVKSWPKLSLSQMAASLSKVANTTTPVTQFNGLKMKKVIK